MGIEGEKPRKDYQRLGDQVKVRTRSLAPDNWANTTLKDVGKSMAQDGMTYLGSAALHFYATPQTVVTVTSEGAVKCQFCLGEVSDSFAALGFTRFVKEGAALFGHAPSSNDPNDTRE